MGAALLEVEQPIGKVYKQAPNAGPEAQRIWEKGSESWEGADKQEGWQPEPLRRDRVASVQEARRCAFFFIQLWGRKGHPEDDPTINPLACMSHYQPGLVTCDEDSERLERFRGGVVQNFVAGLDPGEYWEMNFGPRKRIILIETDVSGEEMLRRLYEVPTEPYKQFFPHLAPAQQEIQRARLRFQQTADHRLFSDIFDGRLDGSWRPFQEDGSEMFEWGWKEEATVFIAINPDFDKQTLDSLIKGATVEETGRMLTIIDRFMKGKRGKNRFVVQLDNGEDVVCCNTATNAQSATYSATGFQLTSEFIESTQEIKLNMFKIFGYDIGVAPFVFPHEQNDVCSNCKKQKGSSAETKQCHCDQKSN